MTLSYSSHSNCWNEWALGPNMTAYRKAAARAKSAFALPMSPLIFSAVPRRR